MEKNETMYSCHEVAALYGVKVSTVWNWIRTKRLQAIKIGKLYRIKPEELTRFETERQS